MSSPSASRPFDPRRVRLHRARAARRAGEHFIAARAADDLCLRVAAVNRTFSTAVAFGPARLIRDALAAHPDAAAKIGTLIHLDAEALDGAAAADLERLPVGDGAADLFLSVLGLHWVNDLPGALIQIRRALRPDGLFLGAALGGATLNELRACLLEAELAASGGASPRVSPFADARDLGGLLQRAGFALPVCDSDALIVRYRDPARLVQDLRDMGETDALADAPRPLTRAIWAHAMALYGARFPAGDDRVRATFEVITMTGWAPHESQQQPLRPGSARMRLADALGVQEQSAGEAPSDQT